MIATFANSLSIRKCRKTGGSFQCEQMCIFAVNSNFPGSEQSGARRGVVGQMQMGTTGHATTKILTKVTESCYGPFRTKIKHSSGTQSDYNGT